MWSTLTDVCILRERYPAIVNRKRVILQQYNARPHTSKMTMVKSRSWMALNFYPILLIVQTWDLPIITYLDLWRISLEVGNLRMPRMSKLESKLKEWFSHELDEQVKRWVKTMDYDGLYFKYWFYVVLTCYKYSFSCRNDNLFDST